MKRHPVWWSLPALALVVGIAVPVGVAAAAVKIPTHDVSARGGTVTFSTTVKNAKSCAWSSSPKVAGFDGTMKCGTGEVARSAKVKANSTTRTRDYMLTLTVKGKTTTVDHLKVDEAGKNVAVTSVTSTTNPTTTTVPTTTSVTTTTQPPTPSFSYTAQLDPSFTQSPSNPLAVTYTYSADAIETQGGTQTDLGATGQLPGGIVNLFSDGLLKCAINVGGFVTGGTCAVTYSSFGNHTVVSNYISQADNVTETDIEDVEPFASVVTVGTSTVGSETVDGSSNYAVNVTVPVSLNAPDGTVTMSGGSCNPVSSGTTTCTEQIENSTSGATQFVPSVTYSGDVNYSSSGGTGAGVVIPVAPAPTQTEYATTTTLGQFSEGGGVTLLQANVSPAPEGVGVADIGSVDFTAGATDLGTISSGGFGTFNNYYSGAITTQVIASFSGATTAHGDASVIIFDPSHS